MGRVVSRYHVRQEPLGFCVEGADRPPVRVVLHPTGLEASYVGETRVSARERFGLFNFGRLLAFVAQGLLRHWRPRDGWYGARAWAERQTARAVAKRLREQWQRLVTQADPTVRAVQRALFAATFSDAPLAADPRLYQDRYLVADVLRHPAAAVAVRNAWALCRDLPIHRVQRSAEAERLRALASDLGVEVALTVLSPEDPDATTQLARLGDWKALFADTGYAYTSLNRTLMNLPGGVPHRQVCNLRLLHLPRPVVDRLELLALALYAGVKADRDEFGEGRADHTPLFLHARAPQLRAALARLAVHTRTPLSPRRAADVRQLVCFLADYPDRHLGNLVGLAEKAVRWHRGRQREQTAATRAHYGAHTPTAPPPVPPPALPGVTFLATVAAVCAEAERMGHCVASYVDMAVLGNCFLFHVEHRGEEATVEVGWDGAVRQAQGPRNQRSRAARWGKRVLGRWAAAFPPTAVPRAGAEEEGLPF